jgi:hypothetical protein
MHILCLPHLVPTVARLAQPAGPPQLQVALHAPFARPDLLHLSLAAQIVPCAPLVPTRMQLVRRAALVALRVHTQRRGSLHARAVLRAPIPQWAQLLARNAPLVPMLLLRALLRAPTVLPVPIG